mmetsp:Transcript_130352/g.260006  ORF Transcript_130352/g.260006 Transcript_130352/m.260006 type:complete len:445 (-) Transcript_130352:22-1356(-)
MAKVSVVVLWLLVATACATRLRRPTEAQAPSHVVRRRGCNAHGGGTGLLQGVFADGFSRVACEVDIAPESVRISFKEKACGDVASCRLLTLPMQPRLCFDFCRQHAEAKFFGLQGSNCYCSPYYHAKSTGGQGACSFHCEGDKKELCGGPEKSSLFEMHMCGNSQSEADYALESSSESEKAARALVNVANTTAFKLVGMANAWQLGVCSMGKEGQRLCSLTGMWVATANDALGAASKTAHSADKLSSMTKQLEGYMASAKDAGESLNASLASKMELTTSAVLDASAQMKGSSAGLRMELTGIGGPLSKNATTSYLDGFKALGDTKAGWFALCALEPISGQAFAALSEDTPEGCASQCLSLSSGTNACAAFNYQYKEGLATCQLLSGQGLVEPRLLSAIPIFEVSKSKRDAMGLASLGCYASGSFVAGHPRGPLGVEVIKKVVVE